MVRDGSAPRGESLAELQWSHVFSDMVSGRGLVTLAARQTQASMEPCLFRHGKKALVEGESLRNVAASMEPCLFRHGKKGRSCARHLAVVASMEPCLFRHGKGILCPKCCNENKASMEPCLFRHGKRLTLESLRKEHPGFNGAMSFQTW